MSVYLGHYLNREKSRKAGEDLPSLKVIKSNYIQYLLNITGNNLEETAKILDVPRASLEKDING
jgi:ActR/RegA family two-component response regulator